MFNSMPSIGISQNHEWLVFAFGKLCLVVAIGLAFDMGQTVKDMSRRTGGDSKAEDLLPTAVEKPLADKASYNIITQRNVFGHQSKPTTTANESAPKSSLNLRLVGTSVGTNSQPFAIIENGSNKEQDTFDLNDMIYEQAKLLAVFPSSVRISHNGQVETLLIEESPDRPMEAFQSLPIAGEQTSFDVDEKELNNALANLPVLLSQARAVPYFKNGESIGMRLFAIRRGSLYEKLGLKNGDILKSVNNNSLSDPSQALKIFEKLKSERSIYVQVERSGRDIKLDYDIR